MSSVRNGSQLKKAEEKVLLPMKMPRFDCLATKAGFKNEEEEIQR